ncbi:ArnT family glycosyltransferase [Mesorhizobium sp. L-8-3]|uniref:ArnT family glycosyltransferase n=1 Tax=Mesorhizobium sp. L-8-3 TaxID=2744522 RepID=UPI0019371236|nr:glycosyltransferase family 39 protein [Mesorhizobium sp. L-8-3]BCH24056.1 glycosyl transferase [Mesorhizobium sp. L-8-3]
MAAGAIDHGAASGKGRLSALLYLLLAVFCLFAFVPGIAALPPTDRDESRFIQSSKQMVESGDFVDIRLQDEPRYKKPAGIYWLQSAAVLASGRGADAPVWVYRIVSVAGATLSVLALAWLGARMFGNSAGLIAGFGLAGLLMLAFEARIAKTDATLLAAVLFAQGALAHLYLCHKEGRTSGVAAWVFWIAQGAGILIKGPIAPAISALTVAAVVILDKDRAWLKTLRAGPGVLIALLVAAPWLGLITWKSGAAFWQEAIGRDFLGKIGSGQESHGAPPGYYFLLFSLTFWPFAVPAVNGGLNALNRFRTDPRLLFCLAWYLPYWIVVEVMPTKLPHYMLPAYPALLLLMAWALTDGSATPATLRRWQLWLYRATVFGAVLVTVLLAAVAVAAVPYVVGTISWWGILAALLILVTGWLASGIRPALPPLQRTVLAAAGAAVSMGLLAGLVAPALKPIWLSPEIATQFKAVKPCPDSRLISAGYHEPSLVFLAGTRTMLTDGATAAAELGKDACAVALIADDQLEAFDGALTEGISSIEELGRVEGVNYSKGHERILTFFGKAR